MRFSRSAMGRVPSPKSANCFALYPRSEKNSSSLAARSPRLEFHWQPGNRDHDALAVVALAFAEESAHEPPAPSVAAGETQLLREHVRVREVGETGVHRVDGLRQADAAADDAGVQRTAVAHHRDVASAVRGDRRQVHAAEVVGRVQVTELEAIGVRLGDLREELARTERHRGPRGRVRIRQDVVRVVAIPSVGIHCLIDDARRHAEARSGRHAHRRAHAGPIAGVEVLLDAQVGLDGVHVPTHAIVVRRDAAGCLVAEGNVRAELDVAAGRAAVNRGAAGLAEDAVDAELRLVADVAHRARERSGAEQGALRTAKHLDARNVEQVHVGREQRQRDRYAIQIHANLFLHAGLVSSRLAGRSAAHGDLALTWSKILDAEPRLGGGDVLDGLRAARAAPTRSERQWRRERPSAPVREASP